MEPDIDTRPLHQISSVTRQQQYHYLALELFSEAIVQLGKIMRSPDRPRGALILTLERTICALREEPFRPVTEYERRVKARAIEMLEIADQSLSGPDTTEGRVRLFGLVSELREAR